MILIDASVWLDHFRRSSAELHRIVELKDAAIHPLVIGELAMGGLPDRRETLRALARLPAIAQVSHGEVMAFVEWQRLPGKGIGFVDAHLLAAVRAADGCRLWTRDRRLHAEAAGLGIAYIP